MSNVGKLLTMDGFHDRRATAFAAALSRQTSVIACFRLELATATDIFFWHCPSTKNLAFRTM